MVYWKSTGNLKGIKNLSGKPLSVWAKNQKVMQFSESFWFSITKSQWKIDFLPLFLQFSKVPEHTLTRSGGGFGQGQRLVGGSPRGGFRVAEPPGRQRNFPNYILKTQRKITILGQFFQSLMKIVRKPKYRYDIWPEVRFFAQRELKELESLRLPTVVIC